MGLAQMQPLPQPAEHPQRPPRAGQVSGTDVTAGVCSACPSSSKSLVVPSGVPIQGLCLTEGLKPEIYVPWRNTLKFTLVTNDLDKPRQSGRVGVLMLSKPGRLLE